MTRQTKEGETVVWLIPALAVTCTLLLGSALHLHRQNQQLRNKISSRKYIETKNDNDNANADLNKDVNSSSTTHSDHNSKDNSSFTMKEIGIVQSPFPQRAGCPRQGTVAPHVRSRLILHSSYTKKIVEGLEQYSHIWVIFSFHLNPRGKANGQGSNPSFTSEKIKAPRAPTKIGVLASRAPHRPNPVGLSLCLLEDVTTVNIHFRKHVCLTVRGLDLVDGTPVYDVKPYVPWDRVDNVMECGDVPRGLLEQMRHLKVPSWVSANDELSQVQWSNDAIKSLEEYIDILAPLFTQVDDVQRAIAEIVAQDPRAAHDGRGHTSANKFDFTFGQLRVSFQVQEDSAEIISVSVDKGDLCALPGSYPYNLAQRRLAETRAGHQKLNWANPVREGITEGLFELCDGTTYEQTKNDP